MKDRYTQKVYDVYAIVYDVIFGKSLEDGRRIAVELLEPRPRENILEVGVGTGLSIPYFPRDTAITGIDLSRKMLEVSERRLEKMGRPDVCLHRMDATHLDFPDETFDGAIALYCLSCVELPVKVLLEMKRVVRPGGRIVFMNHFRSPRRVLGLMERAFSPLGRRLGFRTDLELSPLLQKTGLRNTETRGLGPLGMWKAVRAAV